jgi:hypothetical protein
MYPRCCLVVLLQSCLFGSVALAGHSSDLFREAADYEAYDYTILDPNTAYGSPYGGFSRSTRSRLAALPLYLPPNTSNNQKDELQPDNENGLFVKVRDTEGRLFACRVYNQDELDEESLTESVFDVPVLLTQNSDVDGAAHAQRTDDGNKQQHQQLDNTQSANRMTVAEQRRAARERANDGSRPPSELWGKHENAAALFKPKLNVQMVSAETGEITHFNADQHSIYTPMQAKRMVNANTRLGALQGVCAHVHLGWWSYEWCFEKHVTQFHIELDVASGKVVVSDYKRLGDFVARTMETDEGQLRAEKNELAGDLPELARTFDSYMNGDVCPETNGPRTTTVQMVCCSPDIMASRRDTTAHVKEAGKVKHNNDNHSPLAFIYSLVETKDAVCQYTVTVCTTLLCDTPLDGEDGSAGLSPVKKNSNEKESVLDILQRTLGELCLQSNAAGGWWTYEYCHSKNVRQFHEEIGSRQGNSGSLYISRVVQSENILGKYVASPEDGSRITPENEWMHVVNASDTEKGGGNGAYYETEYMNGDVCDHSDVTDAAVIAGSAKSQSIARSCSVRYYCGSNFFVSVNEDSSCHYIVEVTVPDLCEHALFKAPVTKQQVAKCLLVDDEEEEPLPF